MSSFVTNVRAIGVYGRFDFSLGFRGGVNVVYGRNGAGKTTILHILANVLNSDYERFAHLSFDKVEVDLDDGCRVRVTRRGSGPACRIQAHRDGKVVFSERLLDIREREEKEMPAPSRERRTLAPAVEPILPAAYFPAFRAMLEAWAVPIDEGPRRALVDEADRWRGRSVRLAPPEIRQARTTAFARALFGQFVPLVSYPSLFDIEWELQQEVRQALIAVGASDRVLLSRAVLEIIDLLQKGAGRREQELAPILEQVRVLSEKLEDLGVVAEYMRPTEVYGKLLKVARSIAQSEGERLVAPIVDVYRTKLQERVRAQEQSFETIQRYLAASNDFLERKKLEITRASTGHPPAVQITFDDGTRGRIRALSSGERQIATMIYAATHMSQQQVLLVDEPEISLQVDWQRLLLSRMEKQLGERQIIACTHSPVIGADYEDRMVEIAFRPTGEPKAGADEDAETEALN